MTSVESQDLTGLAVVIGAALAMVIFVFLKMSGVIHRRGARGAGRGPPPASFG